MSELINPHVLVNPGRLIVHLHDAVSILSDLVESLEELEPGGKFDVRLLNPEEITEIANLFSIRASLVQSWRWLECREKEIFAAAKARHEQGRVDHVR